MIGTDVFICGGGPAGLAAAIATRQQGFSVVVADCFKPPIDKACGEGLMPDAIEALARLGVAIDYYDAGVFRGIRFVEGARSAEARFGSGAAVGVRRVRLHDRLHRRAAELGVEFLWGTQVTGAVELAGDVLATAGGEEIRARWLVGADGLNSRVRKWAGLESGRQSSRRVGLRRHYRVAPWTDFMEIYWAESGQAYVTPVGKDEIGVALVGRERYESVEAALREFPELAARLKDAEGTSTKRGALTTGRRFRRVATARTALLGDASGSVDSICGAGLGIAFLQAIALAGAIRGGDLGEYEQEHRAILRRPELLSRGMLWMDRSSTIRKLAMSSLRRNPRLMERMLSVHVGAVPLSVWGRDGLASLGLQLLRG